MSRMDRMLNSKKDKQTIYEIYRACRLCGAGAGYKMPIIQSVVDVDDTDVELKQKIRECVQIEVDQDDKMPPLICELCVDKVNDFYEFLEMCRQTNKRTRLKLGLPPQSMPRGAPDAGDCILGLTEPVYVNEDSDGEPLAKHKKLNPRVKVKKEPELMVKLENRVLTESRSSRCKSTRRPPTPPRTTRHSKNTKDVKISLNRMQEKSKSSPKVTPKSILKKEAKNDDTSLLTPRFKRSRDKEPVKLETPVKKVKIAMKSASPPTPKSSPKCSPRVTRPAKSPRVSPKRPPSPPRPLVKCIVCGQTNKTIQANTSHMRIHFVSFTNKKLACNPCGLWFSTAEEASSHHKHHRSKSKPYTCSRCTADFKHLSAYDEHFENKQCIPWNEVPDAKCDVCWHLFATNKLLDEHKCLGEDHRPGGKCSKCNRSYALLKNLKKHEQNCTAKKKGELIVDPVLLGKLKPIQVRVSRCDPLLMNIKQEHYDVSTVTAEFGLDKNCVYPYISSVSSLGIKSEPEEYDGMVAIKQEIKEEFCTEEDYVHWDSEDSESDEDLSCNLVLNPFAKKKRIDTLATLTLKTLFSQRCLGKVPRKRRRLKQERSMFDTLLGNEDCVTRDINNIIDNLGDDDEFGGDSGDKNGDVNDESAVTDKSINISDENRPGDAGGSTVKVVDASTDVVDASIDSVNNKTTETVHEEGTDNVDVSHNDANIVDGNDHNDAQNDGKLSDVIGSGNGSSEKIDESKDVEKNDQNSMSNDVCDESLSMQEEKNNKSVANNKKNENNTCNDDTGSNKNLSSGNNDDLTRIGDKGKVNNGSINNISVNNNDFEVSRKKDDNDSKFNDIAATVGSRISNKDDKNDVNDGDNDNDLESANNEESNAKNDFENNQDSNSIGTFNESLLNDNTESDVISENDKELEKDFNAKFINDNATSISEIDENKTQTDDFSIESQDSKVSDFELKLLRMNTKDSGSGQKNDGNERTNDDRQTNDSDIMNAINVIKTKKSNDPEDMDDTKLMEALDAEIGESNDSQGHDNFNDKIALEELISAKHTEKSMDLDIIPDEFNFDS